MRYWQSWDEYFLDKWTDGQIKSHVEVGTSFKKRIHIKGSSGYLMLSSPKVSSWFFIMFIGFSKLLWMCNHHSLILVDSESSWSSTFSSQQFVFSKIPSLLIVRLHHWYLLLLLQWKPETCIECVSYFLWILTNDCPK